ncbi:MAG: S-layer homology domain-containing protein [Candidatus Peregrinibacteria bacterium]
MAAKKNMKKFVKELSKNKHHTTFLFLLVLVCSISLYAIFSYVGSTNDHLNNIYASVVSGETDPMDAYSGTYSEPYQDESIFADLFPDVGRDHVHAVAIGALYEAGIIKGYDDGTFRPDNLINRAELLTIITNALDSDFSDGVYSNCFSDVQDQWFAVFVCYAKDQGWISGFSDGSYKAQSPVVKAEALKIVFNAFGYEPCGVVSEEPFSDVEINAWYAPYACAAKRDGIITSRSTFDASYEINRAEYAQIIYNVMTKLGLL